MTPTTPTTPKFVLVAAVAGVVSLLLSLGIALQVQRSADIQRQSDCEQVVANRNDGRAMWLYALGLSDPDQTAQDRIRLDAFKAELNDRLPKLKCVDGDPVPVKAPKP